MKTLLITILLLTFGVATASERHNNRPGPQGEPGAQGAQGDTGKAGQDNVSAFGMLRHHFNTDSNLTQFSTSIGSIHGSEAFGLSAGQKIKESNLFVHVSVATDGESTGGSVGATIGLDIF